MGVLRLILALVVVFAHNQLGHKDVGPGAYIAVKAFFIISGFYMALILRERYHTAGVFVFWGNRLLRLMPMYYGVLLLTFFALLLTPGGRMNVFLDLNVWHKLLAESDYLGLKAYLLFTNLTGIGIETTIFATFDTSTRTIHRYEAGAPGNLLNNFMMVPQAWSISVELFFYLLAPFILRAKPWVFAGIVLLAVGVRLGISFGGFDYNPVNRSVAPFEMIYFLLGVISYHIYARVGTWKMATRLAPVVGLFIIAFTVGYEPLSRRLGKSLSDESWLWWAYFLSLTASLPCLFLWTKNLKWDNAIGELSYPVYLTHILVLSLFDFWGGPKLLQLVGGTWMWNVLNIAVVLIASQLLVRYVGRPIERYRRQRLANATTEPPQPTPARATFARVQSSLMVSHATNENPSPNKVSTPQD